MNNNAIRKRAERAEKRRLKFLNRRANRPKGYKPGPNRMESADPSMGGGAITVRLREGGKRVRGLTIIDVSDGARHKESNELIREGSVHFQTLAGKRWSMRFSEFQFVFNEKAA